MVATRRRPAAGAALLSPTGAAHTAPVCSRSSTRTRAAPPTRRPGTLREPDRVVVHWSEY
eukprot:4507719-Prymnesium_polylepis.1